MENIDALLSVFAGLLIRLGIPLIGTILVIMLLRKLDNRWKAEAVESMNAPMQAAPEPCWEFNNCSPEAMENCPAAQNPSTPCWQLFRNDKGVLREECLGCEVFRLAPLPVTGD